MSNFPIKFSIAAAIILIVAGLIYRTQQTRLPMPEGKTDGEQVKSAHFVDSTPLHDDVYAAQPVNITINFNFDLAQGSKLSITSADGKEWGEGEVLIEDQNTALKRNLKQTVPNGNYIVKYTACLADQSCQNGQFSFKIDSTQKSQYQDLREQKEVTIKMKDLKFGLTKILISPQTKVTWINEDNVGHFVNTETHSEHTYFPEQNSREITNSQSFSVTFQTPGQYHYHCSAHVPQSMIASLIVSN